MDRIGLLCSDRVIVNNLASREEVLKRTRTWKALDVLVLHNNITSRKTLRQKKRIRDPARVLPDRRYW